MKTIAILAAGCMLLAVGQPARADHEQVRERLAELGSDPATLSIAETPIDGLVQVTMDSEIFFMTSDGQYFIQGRVVNLDTQVDLTELAQRGFRQQLLANLDTGSLLSYGPEDAAHEVIVFTDTDCGYCRRLHALMDGYASAGIRINYAAYPRAGIGSSTYDDLVSIWCADHPQNAMDLAQTGQALEPKQCAAPIESHYELGRQLGIGGTPTLVTGSGELIAGYVQPDDLRQRLDQATVAPEATR
jgi:thiol:disulfide interchange protein DsbC